MEKGRAISCLNQAFIVVQTLTESSLTLTETLSSTGTQVREDPTSAKTKPIEELDEM